MSELTVLMTPEESARLLRISRSRVYELMRDGAIPRVRIGRLVRLRVDSLLEYIDAQTGIRS